MTSASTDDGESITDRVHHHSWSANLETPRHGEDRALVVAHAIDAVAHTAPGNHVNLVTHGDHGHPSSFLYDALTDEFEKIDVSYVEQCGCGGHVTRVTRGA